MAKRYQDLHKKFDKLFTKEFPIEGQGPDVAFELATEMKPCKHASVAVTVEKLDGGEYISTVTKNLKKKLDAVTIDTTVSVATNSDMSANLAFSDFVDGAEVSFGVEQTSEPDTGLPISFDAEFANKVVALGVNATYKHGVEDDAIDFGADLGFRHKLESLALYGGFGVSGSVANPLGEYGVSAALKNKDYQAGVLFTGAGDSKSLTVSGTTKYNKHIVGVQFASENFEEFYLSAACKGDVDKYTKHTSKLTVDNNGNVRTGVAVTQKLAKNIKVTASANLDAKALLTSEEGNHKFGVSVNLF